jgi:hypothetical protein
VTALAIAASRSESAAGAEIAYVFCYSGEEMSMASSSVTVEILRGIRDEIRGLRADTNHRFDETNERLEANNHRLSAVESTLLDLAEQQRFVVRYTRTISERDSRLEPRVIDLETRVEKLESK